MTGQQQCDELHRQIWSVANEVRGAVDGWDFKQFVLGALFFRFISENFTDYIQADDDSINDNEMSDAHIAAIMKMFDNKENVAQIEGARHDTGKQIRHHKSGGPRKSRGTHQQAKGQAAF